MGQSIIGRDATVGPKLEEQAIVIGALADAGGFDGVANAGHRREQRVDGNNGNGLIRLLVFVARAKAASDFHRQFHLELLLLVERADVLGGINQLDILIELDVGSGDFALFVDREQESLRITRVGLEKNLLEIQHNIRDIFHHAINSGELVHRPVDFDRGDGGAFQGGKQHAAERVANGMAVTGFKRLGNELGVGIGGG